MREILHDEKFRLPEIAVVGDRAPTQWKIIMK
jgi:hypothetical protein